MCAHTRTDRVAAAPTDPAPNRLRYPPVTSSLHPTLHTADEEPFLPVEEVAERLGVPLSILVRRVEAGDVPARAEEHPEGVRYTMRLSDLGIEMDEAEPVAAAQPEAEALAEADLAAADPRPVAEVTGVAAPPRGVAEATKEIVAEIQAEIRAEAEVEPLPPRRERRGEGLTLLDGGVAAGPHSEVAAMTLDAREVVGGLLDRWERTLEQRIYAEQRQRFESELAARQTHVKHLQLELQAVRAEHAAVQAEKERQLAEKERALADRERELAQLRAVPPKRRGWRLFR